VTAIASVGGRQMRRVFTAGDAAIMAIDTLPNDLRMVHRRSNDRLPQCRCLFMASFADITAIDMRGCFTTGFDTIVAVNTARDNRCMIDRRA